MAIDNSILTHAIYLFSTILCCTISQHKNRNLLRTFFIFLWTTVIYFVVSCSIFPIQFTNSGIHMKSFCEQFSIMTASQFRAYFVDYFLYNISYFASYLSFAFIGCMVFYKLRKFTNSMLLLISVLLIHLIYNVSLNTLVDEVVKTINAEDFLIIAIGFIFGWICAKITLKLLPGLAEKILAESVADE